MCWDQMTCPPTWPTTRMSANALRFTFFRAREGDLALAWEHRNDTTFRPGHRARLALAMQPLHTRPHPSPRRLAQDCALIIWGWAGRNRDGDGEELYPCADEAMSARSSRSAPGTEGGEGKG